MRGLTAFILCVFTAHAASATTLTVYSRLDRAPAAAKAFTARTGIKIRLRRPPPAGMVARIIAEGSDPHWSLAWFYGASTAAMLDRRGLLAHGAYASTGAALAGVLLMAKNAPFAPPTTWADLADPAYRGLIGMNDPQTSDQSFPTLAAMLQSAGSWPAGQSYLVMLQRHGLHIYADSRTTIAALRSGAIQIAILRAPDADRAAALDPSLRVIVPKPAFLTPSVIVMAKSLHGAERAAAQRFIAFVTASATPDPPLTTLDAKRWGRLQQAVTQWFATKIVGPGT